MNSLAYLSRQFDVLASAKTPPSTPISDRSSFIDDRQGSSNTYSHLQRVSTWSTRSFLFSPSPSTSTTAPKRSFSSPSFTSLQGLGLTAVTPSATTSDLETQPSSKLRVESIIRRIFFIRVLALVWNNLRAAWRSLWGQGGQALLTSTGPMQIEVEKPTMEEVVHRHPTVHDTIHPISTDPSLPTGVNHTSIDPIPSARPTSEDQPLPYYPLASPYVANLKVVETPLAASRSSTPPSGTRKTPFHLPKTLVLDLDETLIHSTSRPMNHPTGSGPGLFGLGTFNGRNKGASHMVEVVLGGRSTLYHVYKRPFVDFFLRTVSGWYTLVIFTASMQEYADPVIDWLDAGRGILGHRFFRDSCTQLPNGSFTKDLTIVEADLSRVCLVDNSPISYRVNEANGIPIEGWTHDPSDEALLDLLPVLDSLRFTSDVRRVLGLRSMGGLAS